MKTKVKKSNGSSRMIEIEISQPELSAEFEQVYKDIGRVSRVPGFRPGKAPQDLIQTRYAEQAKEEVLKRAIPAYYLKAVQKEGLEPVAVPEIENVQLQERSLNFTAKVDVRPEIKLKDYKKIRIIKKIPQVKPQQVDQALERLRQAKAVKTEKDKKEAAQNLPELNDAFARTAGFNSLAELKQAVQKNLYEDALRQAQADMQRQLAEQLLKRCSVEPPQSLVERHLKEAINQIKIERMLRGEKKEELAGREEEIKRQALEQVRQQLRLSFILEEIARRENIRAEKEDLQQRIAQIARRTAKTEQEVAGYLEKEGLGAQLLQELTSKKTIRFLLGQANVAEQKEGKNG